MSISDLPALNASLNGVATALLLVGFALIKSGRRTAHRNVMLSACGVSAAFLVSYVIYHVNTEAVTRFGGPPSWKPAYLVLLVSHIVLAATVPPLCLMTLFRAWKGQFDRHRKIARLTYPIWLYVSFTGVLIYVILYHLYPSGGTD